MTNLRKNKRTVILPSKRLFREAFLFGSIHTQSGWEMGNPQHTCTNKREENKRGGTLKVKSETIFKVAGRRPGRNHPYDSPGSHCGGHDGTGGHEIFLSAVYVLA